MHPSNGRAHHKVPHKEQKFKLRAPAIDRRQNPDRRLCYTPVSVDQRLKDRRRDEDLPPPDFGIDKEIRN